MTAPYPATLNEAFRSGDGSQIVVACASALIDADLGLRAVPANGACDLAASDRVIDAERFVALRHAMTMAKLALLGRDRIAQLGTLVGASEPVQTSEARRYSIIVDTARSLDGNQQWSGASMPYPRKRPYPAQDIDTLAYGHWSGDSSGKAGFPFYRTKGLRETAMQALFGEPFEGAILALPEMRTDAYPFKPCEGDPFRPGAASAPIAVCPDRGGE